MTVTLTVPVAVPPNRLIRAELATIRTVFPNVAATLWVLFQIGVLP